MLDGKRRMKKLMAYSLWLIVSLGLLVVVRNIARHNFPEQSPIIMGVVCAAVILVFFFYIKDSVSHANQEDLIVESEPPSKSVETRLAELKVLRKKLLISQEECESKGNLINKKQRKLLIIISSAIGLMVTFPPYVMERNGNIVSSGFSFIVDLPNRSTVNVSMLFAEMIGALIIGAILFFVFKE